MQHETGSFQSTDGITIYTESWLPDATPKAIIVLVHGLAEHIGRYQHVAEAFVGQEYAVYGLDHRTHGRSGGEPRVYITDFGQVVADLKQYMDTIRAQHPQTKIFIYGHSMGSFISTRYVLQHPADLAGFISSGSPLLIDTTISPIITQVANLLNRLLPRLPFVKLDLESISRDPEVVAAYQADPLVHAQPVRIRMAVGYNNMIGPVRDQLSQIQIPLLILHGGDDKTSPVSGSELLYEKASSTDKTLKIYPGLYHEIHNEPEKTTVLNDIQQWLDSH